MNKKERAINIADIGRHYGKIDIERVGNAYKIVQ